MSSHFEAALIPNNHNKEEKLAAAKQRLKQFKSKKTKNLNDEPLNNNNHQIEQADTSGRSSPASNHSSLNNLTSIHYNQAQQVMPLDYKDQQLQLHVQTIGILVAEKAELQSKLQQTLKKSDKKQDECDELTGRLKVSRQKIIDLEKLVQQLNSVQQSSEKINELNNTDDSHNQLLIVDELRMRLSETNDKLINKQQELINLNQLNVDLNSQVELLNLKITQLNNSNGIDSSSDLKLELEESEQRAANLTTKNQTLKATINDYEFKLKQQHDQLKQEYQQYVDQFKRQIEGLVDQINRLTDEREASFAKIDKLEGMLSELNKDKESLESKLSEQEQKLKENDDMSSKLQTNVKQTNKEQLLENEIKYFKQQIEILINEHKNFVNLLEEKDYAINNLHKQIQTYESDRGQHSKLLEQVHNDKQTLSRAIQQNKELKDQLSELQDAFVNVTKQNLELATKLESEQFKQKQPDSNHVVSFEWDDDTDVSVKEAAPRTSLMNGVKDRLIELEKENKDLNDYITLMDENLKRNNDQQLSTINSQLNEINLLNETIRAINVEKSNLEQKLNRKADTNNNGLQFNETNFNNLLLLESKFNKVMNENADLKEKNQDLEHVISQLQFETETIVDYITMYQMEREKLNKKYELKDEVIRSFSTQLQVNKLALNELNNYFGAYIRLSQPGEEDTERKKAFSLIQAQSLLNELTLRSTQTLQNSMQTIKNETQASKTQTVDVNKLKSNNSSITDANSVQAFKSTVSVCPSCQGDLFVV